MLILGLVSMTSWGFEVRLKDLGRIEGNREVALVGYGIVVGLSGTGDSARNRATLQSLSNTLQQFGLNVDESDLRANNVASVMVTAELPPYSEPGDKIDVRVASTGDARGLNGGTLLLCPLYGPDKQLYSLAQGALIVGGYNVESFENTTRKNHSTVGQIPGGGAVERSPPNFGAADQEINIILENPDYTTSVRIAEKIRQSLDVVDAQAVHPGKVTVTTRARQQIIPLIARLENLTVTPDLAAKVVVNERSGIIVAGSNVVIGEVSIAHGRLRIEIETSYDVSQPTRFISGSSSVETVVVPETDIAVMEENSPPISLPAGTTVGELVQALFKIKLTVREVISVLESIKASGALNADLIIQ